MSKLVDGVFYTAPEPDRKCEFCGQMAETRPYGPDGKRICFQCSQKPEYKAIVIANTRNIIKKAAYVVDTRRR